MKSTILVLFLFIIANFAFDWWRRYDFETERQRIATLHTQLEAARKDIQLTLTGMEARIADTARILDQTLMTLQDLHTLAATLKPEPASIPDQAELNGSVDSQESNNRRLPLMDTSTEAMQTAFDTYNQDKFLLEHYSKFIDSSKWDAKELIAYFENYYGATLNPKDRELLRLEIDGYKNAAAAAGMLAATQRNFLTLEKLAAGDVERILPDGRFAEPDPTVPRDETLPKDNTFSVTYADDYRIQWKKSEHPEMFHNVLLKQYIPLAMLERVRTHFNERR